MIKNTCPNAGTPSPGPVDRSRLDAELAGAARAAIMPVTSVSTGTDITPNLGRIGHPRPPPAEPAWCGPRTGDTGSISHPVGQVGAFATARSMIGRAM
jgi:hypothetical protein